MADQGPRGLMLRSADDLETLKWQSQVVLEAGFLPSHIDSVQKCAAVMMMADELNVGRITALRSMYVLNGKVSCGTQLLLALCRRTGELEDFTVSGDATAATCMMKRNGQSPVTITFAIKEARALGLIKSRGAWETQPAVMLRWRAIAAVARLVFPDALEGVYTHEELGHPVTVADGDIELDSAKVLADAAVVTIPVADNPKPDKPPEFPEERPPTDGLRPAEFLDGTPMPEALDDSDLDEIFGPNAPPAEPDAVWVKQEEIDGTKQAEAILREPPNPAKRYLEVAREDAEAARKTKKDPQKQGSVEQFWLPPAIWTDYMNVLLKHSKLPWPVMFKEGPLDLDDVQKRLYQETRNQKAWSQVIAHLYNLIVQAGGTPPKCPPEIVKGEQ